MFLNLKKNLTVLGIIISCSIITAQVLMPSGANTVNIRTLNGEWKFRYIPDNVTGQDSLFYTPNFNTSKWSDIKVPGNWELQGFAEPFYGKVINDGTGLYKREFFVPACWKSQAVFIAFDGVLFGYSFWVNGHFAGEFASAFNRQTFDISSFIKTGENNEIAVKVIKQPKGWEFDIFDCWSLSGIYRDVTVFALPKIHIADLTVKTTMQEKSANIDLLTKISSAPNSKISKKINLTARLFDVNGNLIKEATVNAVAGQRKQNSINLNQLISVDNPQYWTAETPYLYTIELELKDKKNILQTYRQRIGIREVSIEEGVLKLNGKPVKLHGINYHNLSPINGRSVTEKEFLRDLKMIHEANCNFIRTSHYPPSKRLLELCDSLGFYVMDEVPFGWGEDHLNDYSYLENLKTRARTTIMRDKNHPSVIIWSVGNENPLTKICVEVGKYVHELDSSRPHCFPQIGSYFRSIQDSVDESVEILTPHYAIPSQLRGYAKKFNRPMIVTEYAHSLGLDFDRLEASWEIMYANPKMAGGAVWHFFDQGILRKSTEKTQPGKFTEAVWTDSVTMYDNNGNMGADGVVYADRTPQVDYWQVRKVYSPVKVDDDTIVAIPGNQIIRFKVQNRYDFKNLNEVSCRWSLFADSLLIEQGNISMDIAPHQNAIVTVNCHLPQILTSSFYYLKLQFADRENYTFYEKTIPIIKNDNYQLLKELFASKVEKPVLKSNTVSFGGNSITVSPQTGMLQLVNSKGAKLIFDGPYARMGRKPTLSSLATTGISIADLNKVQKTTPTGDPLLDEKPKINKNPLWFPFILTQPAVKIETFTAQKVLVNYCYERQSNKGQFVNGMVEYLFSDSGRIDVKYHFKPVNAEGIALETGISFLLPASLSEFRWVGKGPYASYPGKDRLNEFGIYHMNSADLNYQGNRSEVEIAVLSDKSGNGFIILAPKSGIAVENVPEGIILSHNAHLSGRFNKGNMPEEKVNVEKLKEISGAFSIIPLSGNWDQNLQTIFGKSDKTVVPCVPFYNSYDQ